MIIFASSDIKYLILSFIFYYFLRIFVSRGNAFSLMLAINCGKITSFNFEQPLKEFWPIKLTDDAFSFSILFERGGLETKEMVVNDLQSLKAHSSIEKAHEWIWILVNEKQPSNEWLPIKFTEEGIINWSNFLQR